LGEDIHGNIARLNNLLNDMPNRVSLAQQQLDDTRRQLETAKEELKTPFPMDAELADKSARLAELDSKLNLDASSDAPKPDEQKNEAARIEPENDGKESENEDFQPEAEPVIPASENEQETIEAFKAEVKKAFGPAVDSRVIFGTIPKHAVLTGIVAHFWYHAARDCPKIQACHRAIWRVSAGVLVKQPAVDCSVMIKHTQTAMYRQIAVAHHIGALQAKYHQHFDSPYDYAFQRGQLANHFFILQGAESVSVELAALDFIGKVLDIISFFESNAAALDRFAGNGADRFGGHFTELVGQA
jgi:uncharacterized membrane-anchored protein YhcB (DUF1043 family)